MLNLEFANFYGTEFLTLAIAHLFAVASPGPDFAIVTKQTVRYGKQIGKLTALGVGCAILLHVSYAILGFSLVVQTNETVYRIVQYLGAAFLIYLGIMSLRATPVQQQTNTAIRKQTISPQKAISIGFLTNALNVKAMLFFLFLFTSVVDESRSTSIKIMYGVWLSAFTFIWFYFIASIFGKPKVRQFFQQFGIWFDRAMGILLIALAILVLIN